MVAGLQGPLRCKLHLVSYGTPGYAYGIVMSALRNVAARGIAWTSAEVWAVSLLQMATVIVAGRILAPAAFGLFAMAQVVVVLGSTVVDHGLSEALVQRDDPSPDEWGTAFWTATAMGLAVGAMVLSLSGVLSDVLGADEVKPLLWALAAGFPLVAWSRVYGGRLRSGLYFREMAIATTVGALVSAATTMVLAIGGVGVWSLVGGHLGGLSVQLAMQVVVAKWLPKLVWSAHHYRRLFRFGRHIVVGEWTTFLSRKSDDFFVGRLLGVDALGYYSIAYRLNESATTVILRSLERVAFPVYARLKNSAQIGMALYTTHRLASVLAAPAFAGLIVVADELVLTVLGATWAGAILPLRILAGSGFVVAAAVGLPPALKAIGRPDRVVQIALGRAVLGVGIFYLCAKVSVAVVAWGHIVTRLIALPAFLAAARALLHLRTRQYLAQAVVPTLCAAGMAALLLLADSYLVGIAGATQIVVLLLLGCVIYPLLLWIVRPALGREILSELAGLRNG